MPSVPFCVGDFDELDDLVRKLSRSNQVSVFRHLVCLPLAKQLINAGLMLGIYQHNNSILISAA